MANDLEPVVGNWYHHHDKGEDFEVVAVDEDRGLVEIQYFDGNTDELDLEAWRELDIEAREPPEDWTGPVDDVEPDEIEAETSGTDMAPEEWSRPADEMHPFQDQGEAPPGGEAGETSETGEAAEAEAEEEAPEPELLDPQLLEETVELEELSEEQEGEEAAERRPPPAS
ncbi:MAG: hypothetical protein D6809_06305 [Gammaproteobacteria bacterium]|nr:MAG: hypothetical protein D6809_06305 [Gammaproteobacteria bacterium]